MKTKKFVINNIPTIQDNRHPKDKASFLSCFLFCWQLPIVWKLFKNKITNNDFNMAPKNLQSQLLGKKLEKNWNEQRTKTKPSLAKALFRTFGLELILYGGIYFPIEIGIAILQPVCLRKLLNYFTANQTAVTKDEAYFYSSMIVVAIFLKVFSFQLFKFYCYTAALRMRIACSSLIYEKLVKTRKSTLQKITSSYIVNLFSNTVDRFDRGLFFILIIWISFIKIVIFAVILYIWGGWKAAVGIIVLIGFLFYTRFTGKIISSKTKKMDAKKDHRIRLISDVISGIQTIKMCVWEKHFSERIKAVRREELKYATASNQLQNAKIAASFYVSKFPVYVYLLLALLTESLDVKLVFMAINVTDMARIALQFADIGINNLSEVRTSIERIKTFLVQSEANVVQKKKVFRKGVVAKNISVKWNSSLILRNVHFEATSGHLVAIIGPAGSGKSTFLQTILKELTIVGGTLEVEGSLSYASQEPWIFPATLKKNIVFGEKENERKYRNVLRVCALEHDVSLFPCGDNTLLGERGVTLSGGQKARVNLARALYKDSDIYLLDDPLAAVDASVATQIFTECFSRYLKEKTVILVTHQLKFLRNTDKIYILEDGTVKRCGKYEDLRSFVGKFSQQYEEKQVETNEIKIKKENQVQIQEDEGGPTIKYKSYLLSSGHWSFLLIQILLFIICQCCLNASDLFLTFWFNQRDSSLNLSFFTDWNYFYVYSGILLCFIFVSHLSTWFFTKCGKKISVNLHEKLFDKTLQASMKFFNNHASGRLFNRFSRDMGVIDELIPKQLNELFRQGSTVVGVCIVVTIVNYWMVLPTIVLLLFFYIITSLFSPSLGFFKRIAATRRSPILTHVMTTIQGLSTIKALEAEKTFISSYHEGQNSFNAVEYLANAVLYCCAFWTDISCGIYMILVVFITVNIKDTAVGNVGLIIVQFFILTSSAQFAMKLYGRVESSMTSVERVVKYADLDVEKDDEEFRVPDSWPFEGKIVFDSLTMRYERNKPIILNQINLEIQPGEKISIIGRTGAGKSSLVSTLFRLYDFEGRILIDGVDTKLLSLKTLRSKLAAIPQDPVFFFGTLRQNLDPFNEFEDDRLWSALEDVKLKNFVSKLSSGLESPILEGGENFSVGQRQLLSLARAILRNAKIVVFDEATANVDLETDELIQATIRKKFKKSTVLTIAHRLDTVVDSDKILVIEGGRVVEFGATSKLLQNVNSNFYRYVNQK